MSQDPSVQDEGLRRHARECAVCAAFASRLTGAEQRIGAALRFDVDALRQRSVRGAERAGASGTARWAGLAAGVVALIAVWTAIRTVPDISANELALEVAEHSRFEPNSWAATVPVTNAALEVALAGKAEIDLDRIGTVTFARSCWVGGEWIAHLVVQGADGPVMVLLLPERVFETAVPLSVRETGLQGTLMPSAGGSIAILGDDPNGVDEVRESIGGAVRWTI